MEQQTKLKRRGRPNESYKEPPKQNVHPIEGPLQRNRRLAHAGDPKPLADQLGIFQVAEEAVLLPIDRVSPSDLNPRKKFRQEGLEELRDSIKEHGIKQPIRVRPNIEGGFDIIMGERRWRASKMAGLECIPAFIDHDIDDKKHLELALIENLHREDLDPIEEAMGYQRLMEFGWRQKKIAEAVNRSQPAVANALRLLKLPTDVQELIQSRQISVAHGIALVKYADFEKLTTELAQLIISERLTTKALESGIDGQMTYELSRKNIIVKLSSSQTFYKTCQKCPFNAYRKLKYETICLQPDHYAELAEEARKKSLEEAKVVNTKNVKKGKGVKMKDGCVDLDKIGYGSYVNLTWTNNKVEACGKDCSCYAIGMDRFDKDPIPVCLDPQQHQKMKAAEARAKKKALREEMGTKFEGYMEKICASDSIDARGLSSLIWLAIHQTQPKTIEHVATMMELPIPREGWAKWEGRPALLEAMAGVDPLRLVQFALLCIARQEDVDKVDRGYNRGHGGEMIKWYFGELEVDADPDEQADDSNEEEAEAQPIEETPESQPQGNSESDTANRAEARERAVEYMLSDKLPDGWEVCTISNCITARHKTLDLQVIPGTALEDIAQAAQHMMEAVDAGHIRARQREEVDAA